jgi:hypothetical protein
MFKAFNFHKTLNQNLHISERDLKNSINKNQSVIKQKSHLEKLTEIFDNMKQIKEKQDIRIHKEGAEAIITEFERFDDKDLTVLMKLVEVY